MHLAVSVHAEEDAEEEAAQVSALRADPMSTWTWDAVRTAAAATAGWKRTRRGEWRGPCKCGGEVDRAWVRRGRIAAAVGGCNAGCNGADVIRWLVGDSDPHGLRRMRTAWPPRRDTATRPRPETHPETPRPVAGHTAPLTGRAPSTRPNPAPSAETEAAQGPRIDAGDPRKGKGTGGFGTPAPDRAAQLWADSRPVTLDTAHPARLWAARRHLWRAGDPWPEALRWLGWADGGGSLVAGFAPVADWRTAHPPTPSGVQLVHVGPDGEPRKDRGGCGKRSHGTMAAAVAVIGAPLWRAGCVHVAEGVADVLAIAAREDGAALAVGGTAGFRSLAPDLAALAVPVAVWPDGDTPGRIAASGLVLNLQVRGAAAVLADVPPGRDPAAMAGPFERR